MLSSPPASSRPAQDIPALTGARGPAALAVVAYHLPMDATLPATANWFGLEALFARGHLGVEFFFILSGFIIHHVYREVFATGLSGAEYRRFILYRFARIWPLHMVTMAGALGLYAAAILLFNRVPQDAGSYAPLSILANMLMVQSWFGLGSPNVPAWSISAEWAAYLAFPLLCAALMRLPLMGWLAIGIAAWLATGTDLVTHPLGRIAACFLLGMALRECEGRLQLARHLSRWTGLLVTGSLLAAGWFLPGTALLPCTLGFAALILALTREEDLLARFAARRFMVYLGEISFALYMCHAVVWSGFKNLLRIAAPGLDPAGHAPVLIGVVLSLLAAAVLYHLVEMPGRTWLRRLARRNPALRHGTDSVPAWNRGRATGI
ncbi:acyltransferase family protein [Pseudoroseomonas globiformis]|uniref:Acyltransferase family protein n=1 Tax=Teichococcus globiformis TaxID=2307229 RepID=A0ABV7FV42_9PROT